jgi:1,2-diacylglycerol 3-alpha-glucosyltransferase
MPTSKVAIIWERFGEYHHARLEQAAKVLPLHAIEVAKQDTIYDWELAEVRNGYSVITLLPTLNYERSELRERMHKVLSDIDPDVVAVPGWSEPYAFIAIKWAQRHGRLVVLMSDSNRFDVKRYIIAERIKQAVVAHVSAGFAAGSTARKYLETLGLQTKRIAVGYDVVDNKHFACDSAAKNIDIPSFLTVARFVPRKNISTLLRAYAHYRVLSKGDRPIWPLILVGDGPTRSLLEAETLALGIEKWVEFAGFQNYAALPGFYHRAGAFILPSFIEQWGLVVNEAMAAGLPVIVSDTAGAGADLVEEGRNGFLFSPNDEKSLAESMLRISKNPAMAAEMGEESRKIISDWGLEHFADGLSEAVKLAKTQKILRIRLLDRVIFNMLLMIKT